MTPKFKLTIPRKNKSSSIKSVGFKEKKISFNFHYLNEIKYKFEYKNRDANYFCKLIEKIKTLSNYTRLELEQNVRLKTSLHYHQIDFSDKKVTENEFNFNMSGDLCDDAWQFSLTVNAHGRVHGFYIENVFHVVWFDPDHKLIPGIKR